MSKKKFGKPDPRLPDDFDSAIHGTNTGRVTDLRGNVEEVPKGGQRCYHTHQPLPIGQYKIYGGSCCFPAVKDADIYIGFDSGMENRDPPFPWEESDEKQHVYFPIQDMGVPQNVESFKKMLNWIATLLKDGKKVHMGCIGGHGRTGTVMAALVTYMTGNIDSITYVREHYCEKVVESQSQVNFLHTHFGITKVESSKGKYPWSGTTGGAAIKPKDEDSGWAHTKTASLFKTGSTYYSKGSSPPVTNLHHKERISAGVHKELHDISPLLIKGNIWGK